MTDATVMFVSRLNSLSDVCATCSFAAGEALQQIPYDKHKRQIDVLYGIMAIAEQMSVELKELSQQADKFTLSPEARASEEYGI